MKTKISKFVTIGALCGALFHAGVAVGQPIPPRGGRPPVRAVETEAQRLERDARERAGTETKEEREAREARERDPEAAVQRYIQSGRVPTGPGNPYRATPADIRPSFEPARGAQPGYKPTFHRSERILHEAINDLNQRIANTPEGPARQSLIEQRDGYVRTQEQIQQNILNSESKK